MTKIFSFEVWNLGLGIYLVLGAWNLVLVCHLDFRIWEFYISAPSVVRNFLSWLLEQHPVHHLAQNMADGNMHLLNTGSNLGIHHDSQVNDLG